MLSKAKSKAWQLLIEDSNRPAEEIRLATGLRVDVIEQMRVDVQNDYETTRSSDYETELSARPV